MNEAYAIHPNVVAYMCAKKMVSYADYTVIVNNFYGTTKKILWAEQVYNLVAVSRTKCQIFPVEKDCKKVTDADFLALCDAIAKASRIPCMAEGIKNWALANLDYCIIAVPMID